MESLDMELEEGELELPAEPMHLNMGPSHPAMHGTVRMVLELSGETIVKADVQIGYLHRGFEKMCERGTWAQVFPRTPIASTTCRRCSTTWATPSRSRSCAASSCRIAARGTA